MAGQAGDGGRLDPLAPYVAHGEHPAARHGVHGEGVVEVAPHVEALAGGPIAGAQLQARDRGKGRRQERVLKAAGHLGALVEEPGGVEGDGGPSRQLPGEGGVVVGQRAAPLVDQRQRAEHPTPGSQREDHGGAEGGSEETVAG